MQAPLARVAAAALLIAAAPWVSAQSPAQADKKPAAAKPAAKKSDSKPRLARSAQKAVEEATPVDDDPDIKISEADLTVARQVHVGVMPCELGASVRVRAARRDGLFVVTTKGHRFLMHPVESRTGAIRLEDAKRGAMWLQLGNKSMLMSQKLGRRLADECQSPQQVTYAEELKRNPRPSILEAPPPTDAGPASDAAAAAAAAAPAGTEATTPVVAPAAAPQPAASEASASQPPASANTAAPAASAPTPTN